MHNAAYVSSAQTCFIGDRPHGSVPRRIATFLRGSETIDTSEQIAL
jgi:hypothetical protein